MLGYEFEIIYKKGKVNVVADALSKKDEDVEALVSAISIILLSSSGRSHQASTTSSPTLKG